MQDKLQTVKDKLTSVESIVNNIDTLTDIEKLKELSVCMQYLDECKDLFKDIKETLISTEDGEHYYSKFVNLVLANVKNYIEKQASDVGFETHLFLSKTKRGSIQTLNTEYGLSINANPKANGKTFKARVNALNLSVRKYVKEILNNNDDTDDSANVLTKDQYEYCLKYLDDHTDYLEIICVEMTSWFNDYKFENGNKEKG